MILKKFKRLTAFSPEDSGWEALYSLMNSRLQNFNVKDIEHVNISKVYIYALPTNKKMFSCRRSKFEEINWYLKCTQEQAGRGVVTFFFFFLFSPGESSSSPFLFSTTESPSLGTLSINLPNSCCR